MTVTVESRSEDETLAIGRALGRTLQAPMAIGLTGTLGAGKTRLVQGIVAGLGGDGIAVTSPTFSLWQTYPTRPVIHHLDAYRIETEAEFWDLGIEEWFDTPTIVVVEWADRFPDTLPDDSIWIDIESLSPHQRRIRMTAARRRGRDCLNDLQRLLDGERCD
ncbi:MAG TPA: tRNA (adenosine(37)-N6)-threonylcarbamoyltransferase complex ATPase subunit type 1 TsaE [Planctomycetaceae bacterium]|nr:tRNA (adenosine(37)-N6)-threonylcarbamoyltransferase complex ATPase subunit type 1 TsaE [Planctomycetaceae bacterium]HRF01715.1 tRNA (adenosine(37)-N6)-threonylcarbamoyltransferase complex ATPase subunit type 1 TsaE [Pirellulaceae bacterium]